MAVSRSGMAAIGWRGLAAGAALTAVIAVPGGPAALARSSSPARPPAPEPVYRGRSLGEWRRDLRDGSPVARERAVAALLALGEPAVPVLAGVVADRDSSVRTLAIFCLGQLGPKARGAVPALVEALRDPDWIVRKYAAVALGLLEAAAGDAAGPLARMAVDESNPEVREAATVALGRIGPAAREGARPILQDLSRGRMDAAARTRAVELLRHLDAH
jgi:HEAT repeat protein